MCSLLYKTSGENGYQVWIANYRTSMSAHHLIFTSYRIAFENTEKLDYTENVWENEKYQPNPSMVPLLIQIKIYSKTRTAQNSYCWCLKLSVLCVTEVNADIPPTTLQIHEECDRHKQISNPSSRYMHFLIWSTLPRKCTRYIYSLHCTVVLHLMLVGLAGLTQPVLWLMSSLTRSSARVTVSDRLFTKGVLYRNDKSVTICSPLSPLNSNLSSLPQTWADFPQCLRFVISGTFHGCSTE